MNCMTVFNEMEKAGIRYPFTETKISLEEAVKWTLKFLQCEDLPEDKRTELEERIIGIIRDLGI